ncbi:MAG: NapC/NirT family cytochrome c [Sedimentisphaerales bacterium]|nr:NapC/NirT family cytochrome c [Sedimentisphaerales bacterium]
MAGFACALLAFLLIGAMLGPTSKNEFCGALCHEMGVSYRTWELSTHGANKYGFRVDCIDCHLPPKEYFFSHLAAKSYEGAKDGYYHFFGGEYDVEKVRERVREHISNSRCEHCHDSLLVKPGSSSARKAHLAALSAPDEPENRCVECHEDAGHQRHEKLFSP